MRKIFNLQNNITKSRIILLLFCLATLFMGIGYASINSVTFNIEGTAIAKAQDGIFITDVNYVSNNNANVDESKINKYYQTMLNSTITLSDTDKASSITYEVLIYNNSDSSYYFNEVVFLDNCYDNNEITYTLNGLSKGDNIKPHSSISFLISFKYMDNIAEITNNVLNSYLKFEFKGLGTMKAVLASSYSGEFWGYKNSITKIVFQNQISNIDNALYSWDVSENENGTVMAHLVQNEDNSTHTVYIQGNNLIVAPINSSFLFCNFTKLETIENSEYFDTSKTTNMMAMFQDCNNLKSLNVSNWDTSNVTTMRVMFFGVRNMTNIDLGSWDTSKVTDMAGMFQGCENLSTINVSGFKTSNVTTMRVMFLDTQITSIDLSSFDTSKVTDMAGMFQNCKKLSTIDVSGFKTSNVTTMRAMFCETPITSIDLSNFDTSKVTDMSWMFLNCRQLISLDLTNFNTQNVLEMARMFSGDTSLSSVNLSSFNTSNVKNMNEMFNSCTKLTELNLSTFDMSKVTNSTSMLTNTNNVINAYARTENDATILNAISGKPTTYTFVVK